jgi:hypothetical protein
LFARVEENLPMSRSDGADDTLVEDEHGSDKRTRQEAAILKKSKSHAAPEYFRQ